MLSPFRMVCRDFILPEPASYIFFYALFNLRKLLYIIQKLPGNPENKKSEVGRFAFEPTNFAFGFISRDFNREKLKSTVAICIIATVPLWRRRRDLNPRYPFEVYTISNRARSASYATSPSRCYLSSPVIILQETRFVKRKFPFFGNSCPAGFRRGSEIHLSP